MARWIIDDFGNLLPDSPTALSRCLGLPLPVDDVDCTSLQERAVRLVGVTFLEDLGGRVEVRCQPSLMTARAFATLSHWLFDQRDRPVSITWHGGSWLSETVRDGRAAIDFLSLMIEATRIGPAAPGERIRVQPSIQAARRWQRLKTQVVAATTPRQTPDALARVLDPLFLGRWTVADVEPEGERVEIVARGLGYPLINAGPNPTTGRPDFEMLEDPEYKRWVIGNFIAVARSGHGVFDDIDAYVHWDSLGDLRIRYWRILVPLLRNGRLVRLLSGSGSDSGIDLRPKRIEIAS